MPPVDFLHIGLAVVSAVVTFIIRRRNPQSPVLPVTPTPMPAPGPTPSPTPGPLPNPDPAAPSQTPILDALLRLLLQVQAGGAVSPLSLSLPNADGSLLRLSLTREKATQPQA